MIYLDNSATTRQYPEVTREMLRYMDEFYGNPSSLYQLGVDSEKAVKKARTALQKAIGMEDGRVYFTSGGTEADNMAIFGAARALKRRGRRIVTTAVEHPAVLECCKELEKQGFEVIYVGVDRNCRLDIDALRSAVNDETILVSMMHVNNEAGTIMPVNEVKQIMKEKDAPGIFHCDAVQSFGKLQLCSDADVISVSGHKIHGPKGTGAICIREGVNIPAFICGGGQESGKRSGTENVPAIAGFGLAAEMSEHGRRENSASMAQMRQRLISQLTASLDNIVINSPETAGENAGECCSSLLNISFLGTRGEVLLHTLEDRQIYVSAGSACSSHKRAGSPTLTAIGTSKAEMESAVRFSFSEFTTLEQIEYTLDTLREVLPMLRRFTRK